MDDNNKPIPTLADDVEEFEEKQKDYQAMYNAGGHFKEQLETVSRNFKERKITAVEEIPSNPEIDKKLESKGYIERVEKEAELQKSITDDYTQQVLLKASAPQNPKITLPLTDDQIQVGLHHKVWEAIRWLAEWCVRQMKMVS